MIIELLNGVLLGGVAAAAAPVIIHIAHRRKFRMVDWGAMRFLHELLLRKRRRLLIEHWLLLLVRVGILACLGLALCRPAFNLGGVNGSERIVRSGRTSAVLLIDDSRSTGSGRGKPAIDAVKRLALAYLATLHDGDEVSIITSSRLGAASADPVFDLAAARTMVEGLDATAAASDVPGLLEAGLSQLSRHINPGAELVLVNDGRDDGWAIDQRLRWEEIRRRLQGPPEARVGSRSRPRVVVLSAQAVPVDCNLAVTAIRVDRALVPSGRAVGIRVELSHHGSEAVTGALLRLSVNGRPVGEQPARATPNQRQELSFTHTFAEPGSYTVEAVVEGARDTLPADDRRVLAVEVERHVPILLVEGTPAREAGGLDGSLGYLAAALDPEADGRDLFAVTRIGPGSLEQQDLRRFRVVVLGDVPALDPQSVALLEGFLVAGGGVLVAPGPQTDLALANRFWARGGHGFLPAALAGIADPAQALAPGSAAIAHPALSAFSAKAHEAWKAGRVRRYLRLDPTLAQAADLGKLLLLGDNEPLIVERPRGLGRVVLVTSDLAGEWNDLPRQASYVPLVRGLVSWLGSVVLPPRNLRPGDRLSWCPPDAARPAAAAGDALAAVTVSGPGEIAVAVSEGSWEGRRALVSEPVLEAGTYLMRDAAGDRTVRFAVAVPAEESRLEPQRDQDFAEAFLGLQRDRFRLPDEVAAAFAGADRRAVEIWRWLVVASVALLFIETLLTRRQVGAELTAGGGGARDAAPRQEPAPAPVPEAVGAAS